MDIRDEAINVFMGLPGDGAAARADLQPRRRLVRARHGLQPHRGDRRRTSTASSPRSPRPASSPRSRRTRCARAARGSASSATPTATGSSSSSGAALSRWIDARRRRQRRDAAGCGWRGIGVVRRPAAARGQPPGAEPSVTSARLVDELRLRTVVDLRTAIERRARAAAAARGATRRGRARSSLYPETGGQTDVDAAVVPWRARPRTPTTRRLADGRGLPRLRCATAPDSIVARGRARSRTPPDDGAVLVHCAAGKDRTGVVVALALERGGRRARGRRRRLPADGRARSSAIVGAARVVADLRGEVARRAAQSHAPRAGAMRARARAARRARRRRGTAWHAAPHEAARARRDRRA